MCTPRNVQFLTYMYPSLSWSRLVRKKEREVRRTTVSTHRVHTLSPSLSPQNTITTKQQHMGMYKGWTMGWMGWQGRTAYVAPRPLGKFGALHMWCVRVSLDHLFRIAYWRRMGGGTCLHIAHDKFVKHVCTNSRNSACLPLGSLRKQISTATATVANQPPLT